MFKRIIAWFFFIMLLLALILYFNGITHVEFNNGYYNFIKALNYDFHNYEWIRIPMLETLQTTTVDTSGILETLQTIANIFIEFINFISTICNFFLDLVFWIFSLVRTLLGFVDYVRIG